MKVLYILQQNKYEYTVERFFKAIPESIWLLQALRDLSAIEQG